jgi:hypothetical protein
LELEIPEVLLGSLLAMEGPQSVLSRHLGEQEAGRGTRVVSSRHLDAAALNTLYQLGKAAGERGLVFQLLALDNLSCEPQARPIPSLEMLVPALVTWLARDLIDGWLYKRGKDGVLLPWLVHSVRHVQPADGVSYVVVGLLANTMQAASQETPTDPRLRFAGMTYGVSFYPEDLPGRTLAGLFADQGFFKECPEFKREHEAHAKHFTELQPKYGAQFTAQGYIHMLSEGARPALACVRLPPGAEARCVNDEELLGRRFDLAADPKYWRDSGVATGFDRIPMHGYLHLFHLDLHRHMWVHVQHLQEYQYRPELRDKLVLPQAHRDLVDILTADRNFLVEDVVPGKSGGTTILCKGAPGLGKTLTAEVYAEVVGKPLYRVHSGQLGVTASSVERSLSQILQRAARWDCVLLLDEADVYIRRRGNDLEHNAIVAEFLRTLEYFTGLLFMTTNRVADIDDAILSRCVAVIAFETPTPQDAARLWATLAGQLGAELPEGLVQRLVAAYPAASGREIKQLLKLTTKYCRNKDMALSEQAFAQCAVFRGIGAAAGETA